MPLVARQQFSMSDRAIRMQELLEKLAPVPENWKESVIRTAVKGEQELDALPCFLYRDLTQAWRKAMKWTPGLDHALATMLAAVTSTKTLGDQLWFKIISPPSTGKTTLCEALSANRQYVIAKSTIRGFHSGFKTDGDGSKDHSLIPHIAGRTLVIKDADSLLTAPNKEQILGEARDLYDGTSRAHYRNTTSREYLGIRMTMILCGTAALRQLDLSELGARFLDCVIMEDFDDDLERDVGWLAVHKADRGLSIESDSHAASHQDAETTHVYRLTSGYVQYLRENAVKLLSEVRVSDEVKHYCVSLGKFVAHMRARPSVRQEERAEREFSPRLISQLYRTAKCLAVVLNKTEIDGEVLQRVRQIALDTSQGEVLEIARRLHGHKELTVNSVAMLCNLSDYRARTMLRFLRKIKVVEIHQQQIKGVTMAGKWRMTPAFRQLYNEVMENSSLLEKRNGESASGSKSKKK